MKHQTKVTQSRGAVSTLRDAYNKPGKWIFVGDGWVTYKPGDYGYTHWEFRFYMNDGAHCVIENPGGTDLVAAESWLQLHRDRAGVMARWRPFTEEPPNQAPTE